MPFDRFSRRTASITALVVTVGSWPGRAAAAPPAQAEDADSVEEVDTADGTGAADETAPPETTAADDATPAEDAAPAEDVEERPEPAPESEPEPAPAAGTESDAESPGDDDLADARSKFAAAAKHYDLGEYAQATELFEELYRETNEPSLLFNLGQSYWRRFSVEPDVKYLRSARQMFENYDKVMRLESSYDPREVNMILRSIDAQIQGVEASAQASLRPVGPTPEMLEYERKRRANAAMSGTGIAFTVLGASAAVMGVVGLLVRANAKFTLDQTGGSDAGEPNPASAEEDRQLRQTYLRGGQIGFAGIVGASVFLPVGITLTVVGSQRNKKLVEQRRYSVAPGARLLTVHF